MPIFDTFENRLSPLYTWLQQAKKGKNPKIYGANAPQLHPIWPQPAPQAIRQHLFPLSINDKNHLGDGYKRGG